MRPNKDKEQQEEIDEDNVDEYGPLAVETLILNTVNLFIVTPLLIMLTWNVLINHYIPVESIGYGGALVIIIARSILLPTRQGERTIREETETELVLRAHTESVINSQKTLKVTLIAIILAVVLVKII